MSKARIAAERGDLSGGISILKGCRRVLSKTLARSGDQFYVALDTELKEMQVKMANRHMYEVSGRAFVLSGLSLHSWQRAAARGDSTNTSSMVHAYQTPSMVDMLDRSRTIFLGGGGPSPKPPARIIFNQ